MIRWDSLQMQPDGYGRFFTTHNYRDQLMKCLQEALGEFELGYMPDNMIQYLPEIPAYQYSAKLFTNVVPLGKFNPNIKFIYDVCYTNGVPFGAICPMKSNERYMDNLIYTFEGLKDCVTMLYMTGGITKDACLYSLYMEEFI